jgi:pyrroline-5-carboxylate reductase
MTNRSVGFIGGGRVARILLGGLKRAGQLPDRVVVSDSNAG